mmetsp:Transcript_40529/g.61784  ORF Transcript_40529/g.61784 Transcript_40529/m.61784 type:complete len:120 (-) Transcript_40529:203-562(-)
MAFRFQALQVLACISLSLGQASEAADAPLPPEEQNLRNLESVLESSNLSVDALLVDVKKQNLKKNPVPMSLDEMFGVDSAGQPRVKRVTRHSAIGDNEDLTEGMGFEEYNRRRRLKRNI